MTIYSYKASDPSGKIMKGVLEASDEKEIVSRIQDMGYIPIKIERAGGIGKKKSRNKKLAKPVPASKQSFLLFSRISPKDVMNFTQDLCSLLQAGLPVDRALSILTDSVENKKFSSVINDMLKSVQGGLYLSDAMAKYPDAFSDFYVNMVRAGEAGGVLEHVLERLGIFLESSQELKDYIKSAMIYPIFLLCVSGLSIIIMMTFVVPRFSVIFADMGSAVPMSTRVLLWMSGYLKTWWWTIPVLTVLIYFGFRQYSMTISGRMRLDSLKINLVLIGTLVKKIEVARFARTLGTLVKSGVPILEALHLTRGIMTNKVVSESLDHVHKRVKEGERLSKPLGESGIFPSLAVQMIMVGEETGRLDEMLLRVADNYEKTVKNLVHRLISLLEPVLILIMGCVVAFIVISMLLGIFSMNELPL